MIGITISAISPRDKPLPLEWFALCSGQSEDDESVLELGSVDEKVYRILAGCGKTVRWLGAGIPSKVRLAGTSFSSSFPLVGK